MLSRIFKNTGSLIIASLMDKGAYVLLFVILARKLTKSDFGTYNLFLTLIFVGGMIVNFGMEGVVIREVAKDRSRAPALFFNSILLALVFSCLSWPLMIVAARFLNLGHDLLVLTAVGGGVFILIGFSQMASAVIKGYERMDLYAVISMCASLGGLGLNVFVLWTWNNVESLVAAFCVSEGLRAGALVYVVHRQFAPLAWRLDRGLVKQILGLSVPFALLTVQGVLYHKTDLLLLGWMRPLDDVAIYGVAAKFGDFLSLLSGSLVGAIYPAVSARIASSKKELWVLYNDYISIFAVAGFGAALAVSVLAEPIVLFLFGDTYITASAAVRWLAWTFLLSMLSGPAGILLLAAGDQMKRLVALSMILLAVNVGLNLWLIPVYTYNGAAIAAFLSTGLGFAGRLILSRGFFGRFPNMLRVAWRPFLSGLAMTFVLYFSMKLNLVFSLFSGAVAYFAVLAICGEFRELRYDDLRVKIVTLLGRF